MAIEILEGKETTIHGYQHDLESLFYVLIWVCTMQNGPCGELRDAGTFKYKKSALSVWNGGLHSATIPFKMVSVAKHSAMIDPNKFKQEISDCFAPYFEPLKKCMEDFRGILFPKPLTPDELVLVQRVVAEEESMPEDDSQTGIKLDLNNFIRKMIPISLMKPKRVFERIRNVLNEAIDELKQNNHHIREPRAARDDRKPSGFNFGQSHFILPLIHVRNKKISL